MSDAYSHLNAAGSDVFGWMTGLALVFLGYNWFSSKDPSEEKKKVPLKGGGIAPRISKTHTIVADYLKERFPQHEFESKFPSWLVNPKTGALMELDLYNEDLKLAFEINGRQHYQYVPKFHPNGEKDFKKQQYRDKQKIKLCKERGIQLVTVRDTEKDVLGFLDDNIKSVAFK